MTNFLFLHAHPDDEAIFTGGTIKKLANDGHNVHVVFATGGELGKKLNSEQNILDTRFEESQNACKILNVSSFEFLGYHDSGLDKDNFPENAFAKCDIDEASKKLNFFIESKSIDVFICDDEYGIYGHPDHLQAHLVGVASSILVKEFYNTTVDREYLHFVETHLVEEANIAHASTLDLARTTLGMSSVEIAHTISVNDALAEKRKAMKAHASQIDDTSSALILNNDQFRAVYGYEWFIGFNEDSRSNSLLKYCI